MRILLLFLFLSSYTAFCQVNFEKTYSLFHNPELYFIEPLSEGGFIVCGRSLNTSDSTSDFCFFKTDIAGNVIWTKQFSDSNFSPGTPMNEWAATIRQAADGNYIFGGCVDNPSYNNGGAFYGWMDSSGTLMNSVIKTTSWTTSVNSLVLAANDNIISLRENNAGAGHHMNTVELLTSNAQFIAGEMAGSFSLAKQTLVKFPDEGFAAIGIDETYMYDPDYNNLPIVTRFDVSGQKLWEYTIDHEVFASDTHYTALCATADTGLLVCGTIDGNYKSIILTRFSSTGDSLWTKSIGGTLNTSLASIQLANDGGFILAGTRNDNVLLMKLDDNANVIWSKTFGGNNPDKAIYLQQTSDNGYIILAQTESFGAENIYLIKTDYAGSTVNQMTNMGKSDPAKDFNLYPDPFSSSITIRIPGNRNSKFSIADIAGRIVFYGELMGESERFDLSFLPAGLYYAIIPQGDLFKSRLIVKQ